MQAVLERDAQLSGDLFRLQAVQDGVVEVDRVEGEDGLRKNDVALRNLAASMETNGRNNGHFVPLESKRSRAPGARRPRPRPRRTCTGSG
eukprot:6039558-Pyramimonas_sp.AAC.1